MTEKKKLLFLIPNLKHGGAEKVLVNLVNNLNPEKYDITVKCLFDVGVHKDSLKPHIHYGAMLKKEFRGNNRFFQMFPPRLLWKRLVGKERYDVAISYLEGPTTRILSGCKDADTKRIAWIHTGPQTSKLAKIGFSSADKAKTAYEKFDKVVAVSCGAKSALSNSLSIEREIDVLYNTNETEQIKERSGEEISDDKFIVGDGVPTLCSVGKLIYNKGFDRLLEAHRRLLDEGLAHRIYILGIGADKSRLESEAEMLGVSDSFVLLGYRDNPYKYVRSCDLYVCSSRREGFSTAVTEALIVGTAAVSTDCSGARELLGENNEYGIVVENSKDGIYEGIKEMLSSPENIAHYSEQAKVRGEKFSREKTVLAVEEMLDNI